MGGERQGGMHRCRRTAVPPDSARRPGRSDNHLASPPRQLGRLRVRLPPGSRARAVRRDGEPLAFQAEVVGEDVFVAVETDWRSHRIEIELAGETLANLPAATSESH